jgi:hypothetical protein
MGNRLWKAGAAAALLVNILFFPGCQRQPETKPKPATQAAPPSPTSVSSQPKREPIFFIKGDGTLSPGAIVKLKTWVEAWGVKGKWILGCPTGPGLTYELLEKRLLAIRAELLKLGVAKVDTVLLPSQPAGPYDAIYVIKEPA